MGRVAFVGWLYVMAIACLVIGIADRARGWFLGAVVFFLVAQFASRLLSKESEVASGPARNNFVIVAMLGMLVVMLGLFWLQFHA